MEYRELTEAEYERKLRLVIVGAEGLHAHAQDVGDNRATIGWGYTLNRNNNVDIWRASGIELSDAQWQMLARIDAAPRDDKTRLGLGFTRLLNEGESDSLLHASMAEYEVPATSLDMPLSDERVALVSLAYNRGSANLTGNQANGIPEHPVMDAIRQGDRAEAWYQIRYNCWGSDRLDQQYPAHSPTKGVYASGDSPKHRCLAYMTIPTTSRRRRHAAPIGRWNCTETRLNVSKANSGRHLTGRRLHAIA